MIFSIIAILSVQNVTMIGIFRYAKMTFHIYMYLYFIDDPHQFFFKFTHNFETNYLSIIEQ